MVAILINLREIWLMLETLLEKRGKVLKLNIIIKTIPALKYLPHIHEIKSVSSNSLAHIKHKINIFQSEKGA